MGNVVQRVPKIAQSLYALVLGVHMCVNVCGEPIITQLSARKLDKGKRKWGRGNRENQHLLVSLTY